MNNLRQHIKKLFRKKNRPIVFICGFGGSGKTTLAKQIENELDAPCVVVNSDWWLKYSTIERKKRIKEALNSKVSKCIKQEENPKNWYGSWKLVGADLKKLQTTKRLNIQNAWNQRTGKKDLNIELSVQEKGIIIFDGIYLLHPEIIKIADFVIFLNVPAEICRKRSEKRDAHRNSAEYLSYKESLVQKYDIPYFYKYKNKADLFFNDMPKY